MRCARCGAEIPSGARYCVMCGLEVAATAPVRTPYGTTTLTGSGLAVSLATGVIAASIIVGIVVLIRALH